MSVSSKTGTERVKLNYFVNPSNTNFFFGQLEDMSLCSSSIIPRNTWPEVIKKIRALFFISCGNTEFNDLTMNICLRKSIGKVIENLVQLGLYCLPCSFVNDIINILT